MVCRKGKNIRIFQLSIARGYGGRVFNGRFVCQEQTESLVKEVLNALQQRGWRNTTNV